MTPSTRAGAADTALTRRCRVPVSPVPASPAAARPRTRRARPWRPARATATAACAAAATATAPAPAPTSRFAGIHSSPNASANARHSATSASVRNTATNAAMKQARGPGRRPRRLDGGAWRPGDRSCAGGAAAPAPLSAHAWRSRSTPHPPGAVADRQPRGAAAAWKATAAAVATLRESTPVAIGIRTRRSAAASASG